MTRISCVVAVLLLSVATLVHAQGDNGAVAAKAVPQPKLMVVPYTDKNQPDIETALEDPMQRFAVNMAEQELQAAGLEVKSFAALYKASKKQQAYKVGDGGDNSAKTDVRSEIAMSSSADVQIDLDIQQLPQTNPDRVQGRFVLRGVDPYNGSVMGIVQGETTIAKLEVGIERLITRAVKDNMTTFINSLQESFNKILRDGRSYVIYVTVNQSADYDLERKIENKRLRSLITKYLNGVAFNGNMSDPKTEAKQMTVEDFKLPVRDASGKQYRVTDFRDGLEEYLDELGINSSIAMSGGTINVVLK